MTTPGAGRTAAFATAAAALIKQLKQQQQQLAERLLAICGGQEEQQVSWRLIYWSCNSVSEIYLYCGVYVYSIHRSALLLYRCCIEV